MRGQLVQHFQAAQLCRAMLETPNARRYDSGNYDKALIGRLRLRLLIRFIRLLVAAHPVVRLIAQTVDDLVDVAVQSHNLIVGRQDRNRREQLHVRLQECVKVFRKQATPFLVQIDFG